MVRWLFKEKEWRTVAIDTRLGWYWRAKNNNDSQDHILLYQICDATGERRMEYDDPSLDGRNYAMLGNDDVAECRSKWIHAGIINPPTPKNEKKITYIDPAYAPLGDFDKYLNQIKSDAALTDLLGEKMVDDALGQLEVAIKLHIKNCPTNKK